MCVGVGGLESVWGDMMGGECGVVALHELYDGRYSCLSCQGPCLEFVLQHKILDTLHTTGKSDVSPSRPFHQTAVLRQLGLQCASDLSLSAVPVGDVPPGAPVSHHAAGED